jgi:hypothetical protein
MDSIFDLITSQLGSSQLGQIQDQLGLDEGTTKKAVPAAVGTLLGALAKNAQSTSGAEALLGALAKDHDGSILDNLGGLLGGSQGLSAGNSILKHALGGNRSSVENGLGQSLGVRQDQIGQLLAMLAPVIMGALGKARKQQGFDAGTLARTLGQERGNLQQKMPSGLGGLGGLFDADGDGEVIDDIAKKVGGGLLKKLFGGR